MLRALLLVMVILIVGCTSNEPTVAPTAPSGVSPTTAIPTTTTATPTPQTIRPITPTTPRPVAPDGRTGIPAVDQVIDGLLSDSIDDVRVAARGRAATTPPCPPNPEVRNPAPITIPFETWAEDLIGSERRLFVVLQGTDRTSPASVEITLEVGGSDEAVHWRVTLADAEGGQAVGVYIPCSRSDRVGLPRELSAYLVTPPTVRLDGGNPVTAPARPWDEVIDEAVGPLVVYSYTVSLEPYRERPWQSFRTKAVVTYDVGASREIARFELREENVQTTVAGLVGSEVLIEQHLPPHLRQDPDAIASLSTMVAYDLGGRRTRDLGDALSPYFLRANLSPDGTILAGIGSASVCPVDDPCVVFVDVSTGTVIRTVSRSVLGSDANGTPAPQYWREDGLGVVAEGLPNGHRAFGVYTFMLDGSARNHGITDLGRLAPGGRYFVGVGDALVPWPADAIGCEIYETVRVYDLENDEIAVSSREEGFAMSGVPQWSPDGTELLYALHETPAETDVACTIASPQWSDGPAEWRVIDVDERRVLPVENPDEVIARWYDEPTAPHLVFRCRSAEHILRRMPDGFFRPLAFCSNDRGEIATMGFEVDGVEVNSFAPDSNPLVIGLIQLDD